MKRLFLILPAMALLMASCQEGDGGELTPPTQSEALYVIPAADEDGVTYLLTATSLDSGYISAKGRGTEVLNASYWVYKDGEYVFALVYNKGGAGTGASYYLNAQGMPTERYAYTYNRITTYGIWGDNVITVSTGNASKPDEQGNYPQVLLFNYLNATDGSQEEGTASAENFLGNGEKVHFAGIVEADGRLYTSVIPGGMSLYGISRWPEMVTDPTLVTTEAGGSDSGSYTAGVIPSTQYPDSAYVAIYSGASFGETPIIARTGKIGFACGRMRSQYYQTIWAADNGDIYAFSSGYGRSFLTTDELKRVTGTLPSGVVRIKAGSTEFDDDYYVNIEALGNKNPLFRCWHISEDYFLLQLYKNGAESMINDGRYADVSELAIFKAEEGVLTLIEGLPEGMSLGGEPYGENGAVYIPINVTTDAYPSFYRVDARTATATKGLTVEAVSIKTAGRLAINN